MHIKATGSQRGNRLVNLLGVTNTISALLMTETCQSRQICWVLGKAWVPGGLQEAIEEAFINQAWTLLYRLSPE